MVRLFWLISGIVSLILGVIGIFLPLIPTVPLVLYSALAFTKSSPFLHNWLVNHKLFGSILRSWQQNGTIPLKTMVFSAMIMIASITVSLVYLSNR